MFTAADVSASPAATVASAARSPAVVTPALLPPALAVMPFARSSWRGGGLRAPARAGRRR